MTHGRCRVTFVRHGGTGLLLVFLLLAIPVFAEVEPTPLIDFLIKDQFGKLHTSGYFQNSVVIVVSGDRNGTQYIKEWSPVLADSLAAEVKSFRVKFIPHAHFKGHRKNGSSWIGAESSTGPTNPSGGSAIRSANLHPAFGRNSPVGSVNWTFLL